MTHSELHLEVRRALRETPYRGFVIVAESVETEMGDVFVEWRIAVTSATPILGFRGHNPHGVLAELRATVIALRRTEPAPPALEEIGEPLAPKGAA
jgi:hypothetical protein